MTGIRITVATVVLCVLVGCSQDTTTPAAPGTTTTMSDTPSPTKSSPSKSPSQSSGKAAEVGTAKVQGVGTVLVDEDGLTLYLFENDTGTKSTCTGACAATWPALTTKGPPTAAGGADDTKLGTSASDQVTYDGHPLYLYSGDSEPGEANGQGIGGVWFAVTPDGEPA